MDPDSFSFHFVQSELRTWLPYFAIASIALAAGLCSLVIAALKSRDSLLFWLGVVSILYASRLFVENNLLHTAIGLDHRDTVLVSLCLTYLIPIPYAVFARELFGQGWRKSIALWLWIEVSFAVVALPLSVMSLYWSHWTDLANNILIIAGTLLILLHAVSEPKGSSRFVGGLTWPLVLCGLTVLVTNLNFRPAGMDVEPVGVLILLAGLGVVATRRVVSRERQLLGVEQELTTARRIQSSIIPASPPAVPELQIASCYQPMTAVAGDFFDFLKTSETSLTILVADVSGHGVPAALVASMLKVSFAAQREHAHSPALVLAGLNAMLCGSLGGQYVTVACAAIDLAANTITYAGAGHPPGLLFRRKHGDVLPLAENGLFIGPFPQATYSEMAVTFEPGDKLLLYTDGIVEAAGLDGLEFGQKNVEELLRHSKDTKPELFIKELFAKISTSAPQDDLTVVLTQFIA